MIFDTDSIAVDPAAMQFKCRTAGRGKKTNNDRK